MASFRGFIAYPSNPSEIGRVIERANEQLKSDFGITDISTWRDNDIAGRVLIDPIRQEIASADFLVADITRLNFNVTYEIGLAIGLKKRVFLIRNSSITSNEELASDIGIYDTLGHVTYSNAKQLAEYVAQITDIEPIPFDPSKQNRLAPLYVLLPPVLTDDETRLLSRIKKARVKYRSFEPQEHGRLSLTRALDDVAQSFGVADPLLGSTRPEHEVHNQRAAFVAGLANGMNKSLLLLQRGNQPIPLDYRDFVSSFDDYSDIDQHVASFVPEITERLQSSDGVRSPSQDSQLAALDIGASAAENELEELREYYLETDQYRRCLRGEVQLVVGRKGSGKTALFTMIRNRVREDRENVVLDLKPEGYQLVKFKDSIVHLLEEGTREHTITAFWDYVLHLEICHKLLEKDKHRHFHDTQLNEAYGQLEKYYWTDQFVAEGDFAERMSELLSGIIESFRERHGSASEPVPLTTAEITEILYKHDIHRLRDLLHAYLELKKSLWILFDNVDKGWSSAGIDKEDILIVRCLLDALHNVKRGLSKRKVDSRAILFLRDDVYSNLIEATPDRGKIGWASADWQEADMLRELLRLRLVRNFNKNKLAFDDVWRQFCVSHISGEESSQYLIDRCLMRPRCLLDLFSACRTHAVNLRKRKIDENDIVEGLRRYSADLVQNISYEIRDIFPGARDALYELIGSRVRLTEEMLDCVFQRMHLKKSEMRKAEQLLLWYGILGIARDDENVSYIYNFNYDMRRLDAAKRKAPKDSKLFYVNPAFWLGLEIVN